MKKIFCLLAILSLPFASMAQEEDAISQFLGKYVNDEKFSTVYITKRMFRLMGDLSEESKDNKDFHETVSSINSFCILSAESVDGYQLYKEVTKTVQLKNYEELMVIREGKDMTKFLIKETKEGKILELLMVSGSETDFSCLSITGNLDLEQISRLSDSMEIDGLDKLKDVKKD